MGLYDAVVIKDNHIDACGGSVEAVLKPVPWISMRDYSVIIEVRNFKELAAVLQWGEGKVDRILCDNMSPEQLSTCVIVKNYVLPRSRYVVEYDVDVLPNTQLGFGLYVDDSYSVSDGGSGEHSTTEMARLTVAL